MNAPPTSRLGAAAVLSLSVLALSGCGPESEGPQQAEAAQPYVAPTHTAAAIAPIELRYTDMTERSGVTFVHETGAFGDKLLPETVGSGCAFLDYDNDGDPDLLLLNGDWWPGHEKDGPRPTSRLYRNDGDWAFTDVTQEAGLTAPFYAMGCAVADTDGDGDCDLVLTGVGGYRLYRNDGGTFADATPASGLEPGTWIDDEGREHGPFATSAAFLDFDRDGLPDLFVGHYVNWSVETDVFSTMDGTTKSYAVPHQYSGESCRLWRNLGGNAFEDATDAAGVRNDEGKTLGVCATDVDRDGLVDLVVANDTQPDYFYRNRGDGTFEGSEDTPGMATKPDGMAGAGMGVDVAQVDADRGVHVAVGNFSAETVNLYEHRGTVFNNRAAVSGVTRVTLDSLTFALRFLDADLDGRLDLLLVNGHIEPTIAKVREGITYEQPAQLLRGLPDGKFEDVSSELGDDFTRPQVGRGLAVADVDGDGDLDLCMTANGGRPRLLRAEVPDAARRSLRIRVDGPAPGTDALGARVDIETEGVKQSRWVYSGGSYLSQSERIVTFGVPLDAPSKVRVTFPDGSVVDRDGVTPGLHVFTR